MVYVNTEYPFKARWSRNGTVETDITSVDYDIQEWDDTTNLFVSITTGTIATRDSESYWVVPYTFTENLYKAYRCIFTPTGGTWPELTEDKDTRINVYESTGTEDYSGCIKDPDGAPIVGAIVQAIAYGTSNVVQATVTDALGDFTLTNLPANFAYNIYANAEGFTGKVAEKVIL